MFSLNNQDSLSVGFKGSIATAWLTQQSTIMGLRLPSQVNTWLAQQNGRILRLGEHEWMVTGDLVPLLLQASQTAASQTTSQALITVPKAECAFIIQGAHANALMAQICLLDIDTLLLTDNLLMTQLAGVAVILIRIEDGYQCWCDASYQTYLEETITDLTSPISK